MHYLKLMCLEKEKGEISRAPVQKLSCIPVTVAKQKPSSVDDHLTERLKGRLQRRQVICRPDVWPEMSRVLLHDLGVQAGLVMDRIRVKGA